MTLGKVPSFMRFGKTDIYQLKDIPNDRKIVRLTKWLPATNAELAYLEKELVRITSDANRFGMIVYHNGQVALYVNDLTNGVFEQMSEDDSA